jgi:hypothetical protein
LGPEAVSLVFSLPFTAMDSSVGKDKLMALNMVKLAIYDAFPVVILYSLLNKAFERSGFDIGQDDIAVTVHFDLWALPA